MTDKEYLSLFLYTVMEYMRITKDMYIKWDKDHYEIRPDEEYSAVNVRALLLRKYITRGSSVWLKSIVGGAKTVLPDKAAALDIIYQKYVEDYNKEIEQLLEDGTRLDLRESFDDIIYGVFLHADPDRIARLLNSDERMRFYCVRSFVYSIENSLLDLNNFLLNNGIEIKSNKHTFRRAPVVAKLAAGDSRDQKITGYWANLYGRDTANGEDLTSIFENKKSEEMQIIKCVSSFLQNLESDNTTLDNMKGIIFQPTANDWGDFSEASIFLKNIKDYGIGTTIGYNPRKDVAYVKVMENVKHAFVVDQEHLVNAHHVTLVKDSTVGEWRVFSFGGAIDPYNNSIKRQRK